ncbi:TonB-dependent receptor [Patiriisocius marinistellae]|uniref:TonB-dependent receptor n=1 Tax=Patiriisocius marinistellae TaxID=2494560 RepID=A0A5J4FUA5_9FLAO|nr:TonB-dependent receptor [Patiriisocius marinistellae]GEQ84604.1 TonB-dependent receptor [Patiriisocius marinistellae]
MKIIATSFFVLLGMCSMNAQVQQQVQDSTKVENLEEVLIQSIRVKADSPITHSNLDAEDLEARNLGQDIPYMLNYLPSVVTTSDAGAGVGYTYMRVRGSDGSRINVTLNGIPFNDAESQGTFFVNLPDFTSSVQSLQLQRGVGTSTNGSGAFGASLNLLTDAVSENAYGEIANSFGSYNTRKHNVKFSTGKLSDHFEISGRLSNIQSDGYIDRATSDLKSYFLQGAYVDDNTLIKGIIFGGREETYQAYEGIDLATLESDRKFNPVGQIFDADGNFERFYENEVDNYAQDHYQLLWNERIDNNWSTNLSLNYTYGRGYFEQYKNDEDFDFLGATPITINGDEISSTDYIRRRWLDNDFYAVNGNVNYKDSKVDISAGVFYSYYDGDHYGEVLWSEFPIGYDYEERYYEGVGTKNELSVFAKATYKINDKFSVFGDLQGRFLQHRISGLTSDRDPLNVSVTYDFFNPKAGASFELNTNNQFYFSYGRANREPRRSDFEEGIFTAERLDDFELGWRHGSKDFKINTNLFYMKYKNQLVVSGIDDVGALLRSTSGNSYRAGIEIDSEVKVLDKLYVRPNVALSINKNKDYFFQRDGELQNLGNTDISYSPAVVAGNIISYNPINNLEFSLLSKYVSEQFMGNIDSDVSKLDAYFVNDFNVVYRLTNIPVVKEIVFSGLVNNIFNNEYVSNGYFFTFDDDFSVPGEVTTVEGAGYYPQATTNFLIGATVKF